MGLVRVEKWGFDGNNPKSRISMMKDGHVMSINYNLKSKMDLKAEKQLAEDKLKAAEAVILHSLICFSGINLLFNKRT